MEGEDNDDGLQKEDEEEETSVPRGVEELE